jgi:pimeloyl-[acyl-carrier protein] methyl ester esterase
MAKRLKFSRFPSDSLVNSNAIPIVFIHGWGLNSGIWQPLLALFNENNNSQYQLITVDLPGFGVNSDVDVSPYTLTNICHGIEQIIESPAIYLGWSLGGLIATEMAISYPEKVLALISVASSPYFVEQSKNNWPGIKESVLNNFLNQLAQDAGRTISRFLKIQAMGSPHIHQDLKLITQLVMAHALPSQQTLARSLALLSHCDLRQNLSTIKQPFLRLYGQNDSLIPNTVIEQINDLAPSSDKYSFKHASHAPFISHIDDFSQVLLEWLNEHFNKKGKEKEST